MSRIKVMCDNSENGRKLMSQQNQLIFQSVMSSCDVVTLKK